MSDSPSFQDTPLYAWLHANRWYLLAGVALVVGISVYRHQAPKIRLQGQQASWDQFLTLSEASGDSSSLATRLAQAKSDDRIHAWFVFNAVREAASTNDQAALDLLKPELQSLEARDSVMVATPTGPQKMSTYLLSRLQGGGAPLPKEFPLPEPTGAKVEVSLSVNDTSTYSVTFCLYEEQAPQGARALLSWVDSGRFNEQDARKIGVTGLTLSMPAVEAVEGSPTTDPLMVERSYGLFHAPGVLTLMQLPGKGGEQDPNAAQIILSESYYQDGYSTVVGKATDGWEAFASAITALEASAKIRVTSVRRL